MIFSLIYKDNSYLDVYNNFMQVYNNYFSWYCINSVYLRFLIEFTFFKF